MTSTEAVAKLARELASLHVPTVPRMEGLYIKALTSLVQLAKSEVGLDLEARAVITDVMKKGRP